MPALKHWASYVTPQKEIRGTLMKSSFNIPKNCSASLITEYMCSSFFTDFRFALIHGILKLM